MDELPVSIENRRFDLDQNKPLAQIASQFAKAFGYTAELDIDPALAQLLRLRVSQINNCTYCMNLHYEIARDLGLHRATVDTLTAWWETDLFEPADLLRRARRGLCEQRERPALGDRGHGHAGRGERYLHRLLDAP